MFESSHSLILAIEEQISSVIGIDDPTKTFPSVSFGRIDSEKRIKLYAHLLGIFFDEAESLEQLIFESDLGGMSLIKINEVITERIAEIPEDDIPLLAEIWLVNYHLVCLDTKKFIRFLKNIISQNPLLITISFKSFISEFFIS